MAERKIETEDIKRTVDELVNEGIKPIKISTVYKRLCKNGFDISERTVRRDEAAVKYIDEVNRKLKANIAKTLVVYQTLDIDKLMSGTKNSIKTTVAEREKYFEEITKSAGEIFEQNKQLQESVNYYKAENERLREESRQNAGISAYIKERDKVIKGLKAIIDEYINQEVTDVLLEREGILEPVNRIIDDDVIDTHIITADTNIEDFYSSTLSKLKELDD